MIIEEQIFQMAKRWGFEKPGAENDELFKAAIREALAEQAATHAIELRAYEATVQNLEQRIRELEAQRAPEGWKLVPVEPTDQMIDHGCDAANAFRVDMCRAWDAMLMASPEVCSHD